MGWRQSGGVRVNDEASAAAVGDGGKRRAWGGAVYGTEEGGNGVEASGVSTTDNIDHNNNNK